MPEIRVFLESLGWKLDVDYGSEVRYLSPGYECAVEVGGIELNPAYWELLKFTDGDIDGVATGRYKWADAGETLAELQAAMAVQEVA